MPNLTAIVLAAGVGRRMGRSSLPKPFLPLGPNGSGPSFLDRHLELLRASGVERTLVCVSAAQRDECPPLGADADYAINPFDTSATGSTLSVLAALRALPRHWSGDGLLIMDGDTVYERALMDWVTSHCEPSCLFVSPETAGDNEEVRVYGDSPEAPRWIGKGFSAAMVGPWSLLGESLGMIHVAAADLAHLRATAEWLAGWPPETKPHGFAKERSEHEEIWQYLFTSERMSARVVPDGLLFTECDTEDDYRYICSDLYPKISERDERASARRT